MKNFFKSKLNIFILAQFLLGLVLFLLGATVSTWCIVIGALLLASGLFSLGAKFHQTYNKRLEASEDDDILDAREFDYDEDVYVMPDANNKKPVLKKRFQKIDAFTPAIMCYILGAIFVFMAIRMFFI